MRDFPFLCRYSSKDEQLTESIRRHGILQPLLVHQRHPERSEGSAFLVAGHRRFQAACALSLSQIPALILQKSLSDKELFVMSLVSNWNQEWTDLDRTFALCRGREYGLADEAILPALGLLEGTAVNEYLDAAALHPDLLDLVAQDRLSLKGARAFGRFSLVDQKEWAHSILSRASLTANQCWKAAEWIFDLKQTPSSIAVMHQSILNHPQMDARMKADQFCKAVWTMRFPQLAEREKEWSRYSRELADPASGVALEAPAHFEDEGLTVRARLKNRESLDKMLRHLGEKRNLIHSLFDVL